MSDSLSDLNYISNLGGGSVFPLYLYPETTNQQDLDLNQLEPKSQKRTPNLSLEIVKKIAKNLKLNFITDHESQESQNEDNFSPLDILDYIYAVLHSPNYRKKYQEFLKIDFPRIPYPKNAENFKKLTKIGAKLRQIHLLEDIAIENYITTYPIDGDNIVDKLQFIDGKVYINDTQYFENVPQIAWDFYIGGYQPAQKWLKDRKNRKLEFDDILHYQKIIVALFETDKLMKEIDVI